MQLNGITIQPKIGSNFATQYGEASSSVNENTMSQVSQPSGQMYNFTKVNTNSNPEKVQEDFNKYSNSQANLNRLYHGI